MARSGSVVAVQVVLVLLPWFATRPVQAQDCTLTCEDFTACGSSPTVVVYPGPNAEGSDCDPVVCTPPSGSQFPLGDTTVTCTANTGDMCNFTLTVSPAACVRPAPVIGIAGLIACAIVLAGAGIFRLRLRRGAARRA